MRHRGGHQPPRGGEAHLPGALRPAAPRPGKRGHRLERRHAACTAARGRAWWRMCSTRRRSTRCRAAAPSAMCATRPRAPAWPRTSQPLVANYRGGALALAHNGNLTNADDLRRELEERGAIFQTTTDTEILVHLIAQLRQRGLRRGAADVADARQGRLLADPRPRGPDHRAQGPARLPPAVLRQAGRRLRGGQRERAPSTS